MRQRYKARVDALDRDIHALKASHAAKGLLKSGATLKQVRDLCIKTLDGLAADLTSAVEAVKHSKDIQLLKSPNIVAVFERVVPRNTPFAHERLSEAVKLVEQPNLLDGLHSDVVSHHADVTAELKTKVERLIIASRRPTDRVLLTIELSLLAVIAFIAGAWWRDPSGNYEPLLAIGSVLLALLEVARRVRNKESS